MLCHYSYEVKIFENNPETWRGAGVNQAAGRMWPEGRQLAIAELDNVGFSTSHNLIGLHGLLRG
jgi:hypothetical protein